ncbi:MAG TPA: DNA repair protein RecO C-terminal domain-containing protein [Steroidobacteraceae bacterium]|nr:DNA repair protein RecO C-terminal domain-containing protein [Steroidobacteraceae bacterium]
MSSARRVSLEPAFLLHHYPWRDTSRILELLTRTHGRVSVVARGSRQSAATTGGSLQSFTACLVSWSGRGEMGYLTGVERLLRSSPTSAGEVARSAGEGSGSPEPSPDLRSTSPGVPGEVKSLAGDRLMSGFYANELLLRLLQRHDPHPALFDAYATLLERLRAADEDAARALRIFEKRLLEELGWGLNLEHEAASGAPVEASRSYRYGLEGGAEPIDGVAAGSLIFCGASLLSLAGETLDDPRSLADARRLLRAALDRLLDGRALRTRDVLLEMRAHAGHTQGV